MVRLTGLEFLISPAARKMGSTCFPKRREGYGPPNPPEMMTFRPLTRIYSKGIASVDDPAIEYVIEGGTSASVPTYRTVANQHEASWLSTGWMRSTKSSMLNLRGMQTTATCDCET